MKNNKFNGVLHDTMIGICLGDAHLSTKTKGVTWSLDYTQGGLHRDYSLFVYEQFKDFCNNEPKEYFDQPDKRTGKSYSKISWSSRVTPEVAYYGNLFYKWDVTKVNRKGELVGGMVKIVPSNIAELLSPTALAYFYMDDGHLLLNRQLGTVKGAYLSVGGFTPLEHHLLIAALKANFNFNPKLHTQGRIYIPNSNLKSFYQIISPYIAPTMMYKIR